MVDLHEVRVTAPHIHCRYYVKLRIRKAYATFGFQNSWNSCTESIKCGGMLVTVHCAEKHCLVTGYGSAPTKSLYAVYFVPCLRWTIVNLLTYELYIYLCVLDLLEHELTERPNIPT